MKKLSTILFLIFVFVYTNAQTKRWKPTIGINANHQNITDANYTKSSIGFDYGILRERLLKKNMSIEFGILISNYKNTVVRPNISIYAPITDIHETNKIKYMRIPILLNVKQDKKDPLSFGLGFVFKSNIAFKRESYLLSNPTIVYTDSYKLNTQADDSPIGIGLQTALRKEFSYINKKFAAGLYFDTDISNWQYPLNHVPTTYNGYTIKSNNFSFLFSMIL